MNKEDAEKLGALCACRMENKNLRTDNEELLKENAELKERWRKTHEPSELRVQLARALTEIAELKRQVRPAIPDIYNEAYSKALSQKL